MNFLLKKLMQMCLFGSTMFFAAGAVADVAASAGGGDTGGSSSGADTSSSGAPSGETGASTETGAAPVTETRTHALETIDFVDDRFKADRYTALREELKVWKNFRCHQLQRRSFANNSNKQPE